MKLTTTMAAALIAASTAFAGTAMAQNNGAHGSSGKTAPAERSATGGTGGSAAVGGTSASTLGTGGTSTGAAGTGSSIASGGSAAAADGKAQAGTSGNSGNGPVLNSNSRAQAHDGGTFSRSHTRTQVKEGEDVNSRTRTMTHEPGSKPVKSTTETNVGAK